RTGKQRSSVANFLRLLKLPPSVQAMLDQGQLSFGHAKALMGLESPAEVEQQLQQRLGVHVTVTYRNRKGKIVIEYSSLEEFDRIVATIRTEARRTGNWQLTTDY